MGVHFSRIGGATLLALTLLSGGCGSGSQPATYTIGGSVNGLATGTTLTLTDSGADRLQVSANGTFMFNHRLVAGATYAVTPSTQPIGQTCSVASGSGTTP